MSGICTFDGLLFEAAGEGKEGPPDDGGAVSGCVDDQLSNDNTQLIIPSQSDAAVQVYAIDMDISEPVGTLKARAAEALHLDLDTFTVLVLSEHRLADTETLQEQCGTESGLVQIQFVVKSDESGGHIDIIDVLKPNEIETLESRPDNSPEPPLPTAATTTTFTTGTTTPASPTTTTTTTVTSPKIKSKNTKTTRWIVCPTFKELQRILKIPQDPLEWSISHVRQWVSWAVCQFGLAGVDASRWTIPGRLLFQLSQTEFRKLVPDDPGDIFYMHFELLRRTNVVAVVCDPNSLVPRPARPKLPTRVSVPNNTTITAAAVSSGTPTSSTVNKVRMVVGGSRAQQPVQNVSDSVSGGSGGGGGSQQIQLWQFLLELLTDPKVYPIISWYGSGGQFRLHQPEVVASLWGLRKGKPNMNYEKLSRALRYYYDGDMIAKVSGKRFVYRFVMDLRRVLGYSADELRRMVEQCQTKEGHKNNNPTDPPHVLSSDLPVVTVIAKQ
ncbi:hypothetical protein Pcinc_009491 [Petrolisthes cinctipes]|uniref:GA-binding protein alpha chain n=1 Tax=Petrolisthes cinctipes TaxID=88211 RepID=A0AAE1G4M4_PETCI|nr:hypothetical protein Pcinc_009491 [Petrolisthes cinctipes]